MARGEREEKLDMCSEIYMNNTALANEKKNLQVPAKQNIIKNSEREEKLDSWLQRSGTEVGSKTLIVSENINLGGGYTQKK